MQGTTSLTSSIHTSAVAQMIGLRVHSGQYSDIDRRLLHSICISGIFEWIQTGQDCPIEDIPLLRGNCQLWELSGDDRMVVAMDLVLSRLLVMPRVIRLLRQNQQVCDWSYSYEITEALITVACLPEAQLILSMIGSSSYIARNDPCNKSIPECPADNFLSFHNVAGLQLAIYFYTYKVLFTSALLRCIDLGINLPPPSVSFYPNAKALERENLAAAEILARCSTYALSLKLAVPMEALWMLKPMLLSWTCWDRLLDTMAQSYCSEPCLSDASANDSAQASASSSTSYTSSPPCSPKISTRFSNPEIEAVLAGETIKERIRLGTAVNANVPQDDYGSPSPDTRLADAWTILKAGPSVYGFSTSYALKMRDYCEEVVNHAYIAWSAAPLAQDEFVRMRRILMGLEEPDTQSLPQSCA